MDDKRQRHLEAVKRWNERHPELLRERKKTYGKRYYETHKEHVHAKTKEYMRKHYISGRNVGNKRPRPNNVCEICGVNMEVR